MMNYKIIKDEKILKDFINWLPDLQPEEKYYLCLFARNKYCKDLVHIKTDKAQLKRFVSDKSRLIEKIRQLEVAVGCYKQKDKVVPEEALALYITPNPRNMWKASVNTMVKIAQCMRDTNTLMNPHQEALSEIQKAKSRTCFVDFDIDQENEEKLKAYIEEAWDYINKDAVTILKTRGGAHLLVEPSKVAPEFKNKWYQNISRIGDVDQTGDQLIPVPGTSQGMFIPHFINL